MGIADFYLKINFKSKKYDEFEAIYQSFVREKYLEFWIKSLN